MADSKLLDLPAATTLDGSENYYVVQGGVDKRVTGALQSRLVLTGDVNYYVNVTGNDTTGTGTIGNPWLTVNKALAVIAATIDLASYTAHIILAAGTTGSPNVYGPVFAGDSFGIGNIFIETSDDDPTHTTIHQPSPGTCIILSGYSMTTIGLGGMRIDGGIVGLGIFGTRKARLGTPTCRHLTFGAVTSAMINMFGAGYVDDDDNARITLDPVASSPAFLFMQDGAEAKFANSGQVYTITAGATFTPAMLVVADYSRCYNSLSTGGSVSGTTASPFASVDRAAEIYWQGSVLPATGGSTVNNALAVGLGPGYATAGILRWDQYVTWPLDKGTVTSGTVTFNASKWQKYKLTVGGNLTIAFSSWLANGYNEVQIQLVNGGSATLTWPSINWMKGDGTSSTSFASLGVTLQASGTNFVTVWSPDAGATLFGTAM